MLAPSDTPSIPFQPSPLFEQSRHLSTAQAVNAVTFSKSWLCVEVLLFQLGVYDAWESNSFYCMYLETQDQVLCMMVKPIGNHEPPKRTVDIVRVSGYLHPAALTIGIRHVLTWLKV